MMMKSFKGDFPFFRLLVVVAIAVVNFSEAVIQEANSAYNKTLVFAGAIPLTPDDPDYLFVGANINATYYMWQDWVNSEYGGIRVGNEVYGVKIEVHNHLGSDEAATVYDNILADDRVDYLMSPYSTKFAMAVSPRTEAASRTMIVSTQGLRFGFVGKRKLFGTIQTTETWLPVFVRSRLVVDNGVRSLVTLVENGYGGFHFSVCDALSDDYLAENDMNRITQVTVSPNAGADEIAAVLETLVALPTPDLLVGCTMPTVCLGFLKAAQAMSYSPKAIIMSVCGSVPGFFNALGELSDHLISLTMFSTRVKNVVGEITGWTPLELQTRLLDYGQPSISFQSASHFGGLLASMRAIENAGTLDDDDYAFALSRMDLNTVFGRISFDRMHVNSADTIFSQYQVDDDKVIFPPAGASSSLVYPAPSWPQRVCLTEATCMNGECDRDGLCECEADWEGDNCDQMLCGVEDYFHTISGCDSSTETHHVSFHFMEDSLCTERDGFLPNSVDFDCAYIPADSSTGGVTTACAVIGAVITGAILLATVVLRKERIVHNNQGKFCMLYAAGGCASALSLLTFLGENTDTSCMLRPWLFHLSLTIMFGSLFIRVYRVRELFNNKSLAKKTVTDKDLIKLLLRMLLIDVLILAVWTLVTPSKLEVKEELLHGVGTITLEECVSEYPHFKMAASFFKAALLAYGVMLAYQTRDVTDQFTNSKLLGIAVYNIACIGGFAVLLVEGVDLSPALGLTIQALATAWCTVGSVVVVLLPVLARTQKLGIISATIGTSTGASTKVSVDPSAKTIGGASSKTNAGAQSARVQELETMVENFQAQLKRIPELEAKIAKQAEVEEKLKAELQELKEAVAPA